MSELDLAICERGHPRFSRQSTALQHAIDFVILYNDSYFGIPFLAINELPLLRLPADLGIGGR